MWGFSMGGLLIPFMSSCGLGPARRRFANEKSRTFQFMRLELHCTPPRNYLNASQLGLDDKQFFSSIVEQDSQISFTGDGITFLIRCNVFLSISLTDWVHKSWSINGSVYYVKQTHPAGHYSFSLRDSKKCIINISQLAWRLEIDYGFIDTHCSMW